MANTNSVQAALVAAGRQVDGRIAGGQLTRFRFDFPLTAQASGDTINLGKKPRGFLFSHGILNSDTALGGTATVAIGTAAAAGKYRAAAIQNAVGPVIFAVLAAAQEAEPAEEDLILTVAAAALPGTGNAYVDFFCSDHG